MSEKRLKPERTDGARQHAERARRGVAEPDRRKQSGAGDPERVPRERTRRRAIETLPLEPTGRNRKRPFDVDDVYARLRAATAPYRKAAMFELAERGFSSVFHVLVGCVISIRTLDEVSLPTSLKLFDAAPTPADVAKLSDEQIDQLIRACTFHEPKARQIRAIAQRTVAEFAGTLPCDLDVLTSFRGVGPKCANLALGVACGQSPGISVDVHVHRVTNRWGIVAESTPERTMAALMRVLPRERWVETNALLVPFGKHVCTGTLPRCSTCPLLAYCRQVGVTEHR